MIIFAYRINRVTGWQPPVLKTGENKNDIDAENDNYDENVN